MNFLAEKEREREMERERHDGKFNSPVNGSKNKGGKYKHVLQ